MTNISVENKRPLRSYFDVYENGYLWQHENRKYKCGHSKNIVSQVKSRGIYLKIWQYYKIDVKWPLQ